MQDCYMLMYAAIRRYVVGHAKSGDQIGRALEQRCTISTPGCLLASHPHSCVVLSHALEC